MTMTRRPRPRADARRPASTRLAAPALALPARLATSFALALGLALPTALLAPTAQAQAVRGAAPAAASHPSRAFWQDQRQAPASNPAAGSERAVAATRLRTLTLDSASLAGHLQAAPAEFSAAARQQPLVLALPDPAGGFQRFQVVDAPVMEPGLAALHPHIRSVAGRGIDDPTATLRLSITQLGVHASVRSRQGNWYVEPLVHGDQSLYASYWRADVPRRTAAFAEPPMLQPLLALQRGRYHAAETVQLMGAGFAPHAAVTLTVRRAGEAAVRQTLHATADADGTLKASLQADPWRATGHFEVSASDGRRSGSAPYQVLADDSPLMAAVGTQLRTYRLAMVSDPAYAAFHGAANVTAAKVVLMTRVNQVYEDDLSIRMVLIAATDALNLNTAAEATGANGPCGGAACFTASQVASCGSSGLNQNRIVAGLLAGAGNFDVGHLALGGNGGGIAGLGVVGLDGKARGCTGISPPTGDVWAIDYVAHELGHQYNGNHTFNSSVCGGNRSGANSVEPGGGSSVMAYAGICGTDDIQDNSDPYFSQRSFDEIFNHTSAAELTLNELQQAALRNFNVNGRQFQLRLAGASSAPIVRGSNFSTAGVKAAIEGIAGWPVGGTVTVGALSDNGFTISYGGTLAGTDVPNLELVNCSDGCSGFVNDITKGGSTTRRGAVTATGNNPPVVSAPAGFTIPLRTPFALTGSATDPDGDTVTYLWEQNDRGGSSGTALTSNTKANGPLFRQFGTRALFDAGIYNPPGQNQANTDPTRVFPDLAQVLAGNTNAESGSCGTVSGAPTAAQIDCFSEFLPTAAYVGFAGVNASPARLNFRLTARDGRGGVNSADTTLTLAPAAGPFLVTAPNAAVTLDGAEPSTVTWSVAGTSAAPVNTAQVRILLSTDGGNTWPVVLAAATPNDGSQSVIFPNVASAQARVKVEAVGNVFFDVSNSNFTIRFTGDVDGNGVINCDDIGQLRRYLGQRVGDPGYVAAFDFNSDGIIDNLDTAYVQKRLPQGTACAPRVRGGFTPPTAMR